MVVVVVVVVGGFSFGRGAGGGGGARLFGRCLNRCLRPFGVCVNVGILDRNKVCRVGESVCAGWHRSGRRVYCDAAAADRSCATGPLAGGWSAVNGAMHSRSLKIDGSDTAFYSQSPDVSMRSRVRIIFFCISLEADVTSRKRAHDPRYAESEHNAGKRHPSRRSVFVVTGRWNEARKFSLYFKWRRVKKRRRRHIAALVIPVALKSETSRLVSAFLDLSRRRSSTSGATTSFPLAATRSWPSLIRLAR